MSHRVEVRTAARSHTSSDAVATVEGDAGPRPHGRDNVVVNGPLLPSQSRQYNGVPPPASIVKGTVIVILITSFA